MSEKNLIDLSEGEKIRKILRHLKQRGLKVKLWQALDTFESPNIAKIEDIDLAENAVVLRPIRRSNFLLSPHPYLYFYAAHRTTLFKTSISKRETKEIHVKIPQFMKIQEGRGEVRHKLRLDGDNKAEIKLFGLSSPLEVSVLDISENGAAIIINKVIYEACDEDTILSVASDKLKHLNGRTAIVRNKGITSTEVSGKKILKYRIGIEFLPESNIEDFL